MASPTRSKLKSQAAHRRIGKHYASVNGVSVAADGRVLSASMGRPKRGQVLLWDGGREGTCLGEFGTETGGVCWYAEMSSDRRTVAAGFGDCSLRLWDAETKETTTLAVLDGIVASVAFSADGKVLFTGDCSASQVRLWDVAERNLIAEGKTKKSGGWIVALSPDGTRGLSGAADKLVHVWSTRDGKEIAALEGHAGRILSLAFHPDGRRAVSGSQDKTARIWDIARGTVLLELGGNKKAVESVSISPDGSSVATVAKDTLRIFDFDTGAERASLHLGETRSPTIAYAPSGAEVVAGFEKGDILAFAVP